MKERTNCTCISFSNVLLQDNYCTNYGKSCTSYLSTLTECQKYHAQPGKSVRVLQSFYIRIRRSQQLLKSSILENRKKMSGSGNLPTVHDRGLLSFTGLLKLTFDLLISWNVNLFSQLWPRFKNIHHKLTPMFSYTYFDWFNDPSVMKISITEKSIQIAHNENDY